MYVLPYMVKTDPPKFAVLFMKLEQPISRDMFKAQIAPPKSPIPFSKQDFEIIKVPFSAYITPPESVSDHEFKKLQPDMVEVDNFEAIAPPKL